MRQSAAFTGKPTARRRTPRLIGLALILLTLALAPPAGASGFVSTGGGSESTRTSGTTAPLNAVAFANATRGWAVGDDGTILATADGGATWSRQTPPGVGGIYPGSGRRGTLVTISGAGFGATRAGGALQFGGKPFTTYKSWSDERITCRVPRTAERGVVGVTVATALGTSNAVDFRVKRSGR